MVQSGIGANRSHPHHDGKWSSNELKQALEITDGNLDSHIKKLITAGYIRSKKQPATKGKQQTLYSLSETGRQEFENYIETLKRLLSPQSVGKSPHE